MKTLDIQYRQAQSVNIDLGMLDIAENLEKVRLPHPEDQVGNQV